MCTGAELGPEMFKAVDGNGFPGLNQTGMMSKVFINALSTLQHDSQRTYRISKMLDLLKTVALLLWLSSSTQNQTRLGQVLYVLC